MHKTSKDGPVGRADKGHVVRIPPPQAAIPPVLAKDEVLRTQVLGELAGLGSLVKEVQLRLTKLDERLINGQAELMTVAEVAQYLRVSQRTVEKLIKDGRLKPVWISGVRRFPREYIDLFVRNCPNQRRGRGEERRRANRGERGASHVER